MNLIFLKDNIPLILIFILVIVIGFSKRSLYYTKKDKLIYKRGQKEPFTGKIEKVTKEGKLVADVINGKCHGEFVNYFKNGKISTKGNFVNGVLSGKYTKYFPNEQIAVEAFYRNGLLNGDYKEYYENGKIKLHSVLNLGDSTVPSNSYYDTGELQGIFHIKAHLLNGPYKEFYKNGALKITSNYINEILNGEYIEYDEFGKEIKKIIYNNGKKIK